MLKKIGVIFLAILCLVVLLNPGAGTLDIIPDWFPIIGNLDEGAAGILLVWCLQYLFRKSDSKSPPIPLPTKKVQ